MSRTIVSKPKGRQAHSAVPNPRAVSAPPVTEGKLYRVREADNSRTWGEGLTHREARVCRDQVLAARKSRTAMIEVMDDAVAKPSANDDEDEDPELGRDLAAPQGTRYELEQGDIDFPIRSAGVVWRVPADHELLVNGAVSPPPVSVTAGDVVRARPLHPMLAAARAQAHAAVRDHLQNKPRYVDTTVKKPAPRTAPPPPDRTVSAGQFVRLGAPAVAPPEPLPSPLKVATVLDGKPMPEGAINDDDISDLSVDLGGGASDSDIEHAGRQRDAELG